MPKDKPKVTKTFVLMDMGEFLSVMLGHAVEQRQLYDILEGQVHVGVQFFRKGGVPYPLTPIEQVRVELTYSEKQETPA